MSNNQNVLDLLNNIQAICEKAEVKKYSDKTSITNKQNLKILLDEKFAKFKKISDNELVKDSSPHLSKCFDSIHNIMLCFPAIINQCYQINNSYKQWKVLLENIEVLFLAIDTEVSMKWTDRKSADSSTDISKVQLENEDLQNKLDESVLEILNITADLNALRAASEQLKVGKDESALEIVNITAELNALKASNDQLQIKLDESALETVNITAELSALKASASSEMKHELEENLSVSEIHKQLLLSNNKIDSLVEDERQLKLKHKLEVQGLMMQYKTKNNETDKTLQQCNLKINQLTEELQNLKEKHGVEFSNVMTTNEDIQHQLEELMGEKSLLKSVITSKTEELNMITNENAQLKKDVEAATLETEKAILVTEKAILESENASKRIIELEENVEGLVADRLALVCDNNEKLALYEEAEKKYELLQEQLLIQNKSLSDAEKQAASDAKLQAQVTALQVELQEQESMYKELLSKHEGELSLLRQQLKDRDKALEVMQLTVDATTATPVSGSTTGLDGVNWANMSPVRHSPKFSDAALMSPNAIDRLFTVDVGDGMHSADPIVYLEIGAYTCKLGMYNRDKMQFDLKYCCPSVIARVKRGFHAIDMVKGASFRASHMYEQFRETGKFVGGDGYYCCFEHPDVGLRGGLELVYPMCNGSSHKLTQLSDFSLLVQHCLSKLNSSETDENAPVDLSNVQLVFGYKMLFEEESVASMIDMLYESALANKVCFLSENSLAIACAADMMRRNGIELASSILIDIGAYSTRIYPIFDGMVLRNAIQILDVGGEHCTDALEGLLDGYKHTSTYPEYTSQLPRRRRLIARELKHRCGMIVADYEQSVAKYGGLVTQEGIKVMPSSDNADVHTRDEGTCAGGLNMEVSFHLPGGGDISLSIGAERFHCMELLFQPDLMKDILNDSCDDASESFAGERLEAHVLDESTCNIDNLKHNNGLIAKIVACLQSIDDKAVCEELLEHICICGGTAATPGLVERLTEDLTTPLSDLDLSINTVQLHVLDSYHSVVDGEPSNGECKNMCHMIGAGVRMKHAVVSTDNYQPISDTPKPLEISNIVLACDYDSIGSATISQLITC